MQGEGGERKRKEENGKRNGGGNTDGMLRDLKSDFLITGSPESCHK